MPRIRPSIVTLTAVLAACDGRGPFEIEPRELSGAWAGSALAVSVRLDCAEQSSQTVGLDGRAATVYSLSCQGTFRDAARGVDTRVVGGGSPSSYSRGQKEDRFGFGVLTDVRHTDGSPIMYLYAGKATDRATIVGMLVRQTRRAAVVGPSGEVGGPEIVTPLDSVPLVLRRQ